jgi:hypothetical protein
MTALRASRASDPPDSPLGVTRTHLCLLGAVVLTGAIASACTLQGYRTVIFENDLGRPIVLARCRSVHAAACDRPVKRVTIAPGKTRAMNIDYSVRGEYAVESPAGELLRCVVLYWKRNPGDVPRIELSRTPRWSRTCPDSTPGASPHARP